MFGRIATQSSCKRDNEKPLENNNNKKDCQEKKSSFITVKGNIECAVSRAGGEAICCDCI